MSIKFHPDKCDTEEFGEDGCNERFMLVKQAYEILKDDEKRIVWDETGDTGEVHSMQLGLALPEWIVKKENAPFVLGCYVLMFMIILPTVVGRWWYKSIKFNTDSILLSTSNMFQYFIYRSPTMQFKRLLQILTSANEFDRNHNKEIKLRHSDSVLMPRLIQQLPADNSAKQQNNMPMNRSYSIKARSLVLAHLHGLELEDATLQEDQDIVLSKCTMLIYSMIQTMGEFVQFHQMGKLKKAPSIATIDQTMKLSALLVQGIKDGQNPIFQLPYLNDRNLSYLQKKKIKSLKQLACLTDSKRRDLLKFMSDQQYDELCTRLRHFPDVEMVVELKVEDEEEEQSITAGSLVTLNVQLKRKTLGDLMKQADETGEDVKYEENSNKAITFGDTTKAKAYFADKGKGPAANTEEEKPKKRKNKKKKKKPANVDNSAGGDNQAKNTSSGSESDSGSDSENEDSSKDKQMTAAEKDEADWQKFSEKQSKKEKQQKDDMSRISHTVLAPKWPVEKQEHWWFYLTDQNAGYLFNQINSVYNLVDEKESTIQFQAPPYPAIYKLKVVLRSDSYLDCDRTQDIKMYVSPQDHVKKIDAKEVWGDLESEDDVVRLSDDEEVAAANEEDEASDAGSWEVSDDDDGGCGGCC